MRNKPRPPTPEQYLAEAVSELRRLTDALIEQAGRVPDSPVVNVEVPETRVIVTEKEESNADLILEIKRLGEVIAEVAGRKQEPPVVNVENQMPAINFPEVKIPDIHMPEIRIPEIKIPAINFPEMRAPTVNFTAPAAQARTWRFKHRYDEYNKIVETTATPE